jgi:hypothetical protein
MAGVGGGAGWVSHADSAAVGAGGAVIEDELGQHSEVFEDWDATLRRSRGFRKV